MPTDGAHNFAQRHLHLVEQKVCRSLGHLDVQEQVVAQFLCRGAQRHVDIARRQAVDAQTMYDAQCHRQEMGSSVGIANAPLQYIALLDNLRHTRQSTHRRVQAQHVPVMIIRDQPGLVLRHLCI